MDEPEPIPPEPRPAAELAIRLGGGLVVVWAATLLAVVEAFLVPVRFAHSYTPIAAVLAVTGNVALPLLMRYLTRSNGAALLPCLAWFVVVIIGSTATGEGDLVIIGDWPGLALLVAGAGTVAVMGYLLLAGSLSRR